MFNIQKQIKNLYSTTQFQGVYCMPVGTGEKPVLQMSIAILMGGVFFFLNFLIHNMNVFRHVVLLHNSQTCLVVN